MLQNVFLEKAGGSYPINAPKRGLWGGNRQ
jgi:hypothetical protein